MEVDNITGAQGEKQRGWCGNVRRGAEEREKGIGEGGDVGSRGKTAEMCM
jgi:hypothetical protein